MTDQLQPPTDSPRPWWKRWWGITYLTVLGLVSVATVVAMTMPVPSEEAGRGTARLKADALGEMFGALDILLAIALGVGIVRRRFWRLPNAPTANLLLGLFLFALSTATVVIFFFFACMAVMPQ